MESKDKASVEKTLNSYFSSLNKSDVKNAVGSYTPDGVFIAAGSPTAIGTIQLVEAYENLFKAIQLTVEVTIDEVIIQDSIAFVRTHSNGNTLIHATGDNIPAKSREFFLLRKIDSDWKIARYMFNEP
ncbi:MAG: nuclear transport factor 2 family protein [Flavitalea sp.]